jgi:hypothetical protein
MSFYQADDRERAALIKGLRDCADWLEANPDIPATSAREIPVQLSAGGTDAEKQQDIEDLAALMEVAPYWFAGGQTHYQVGVRFGPVHFFGCAVMTEYSEEAHEVERLGREALAARKAAEAASGVECCGRCAIPFDEDDSRFDGHARSKGLPRFCRRCVDACHEADADHRCVICTEQPHPWDAPDATALVEVRDAEPFVQASPAEVAAAFESSAAYGRRIAAGEVSS